MSHTGQKVQGQSGLEEGREELSRNLIDEDTGRPDREQKRQRQRQPTDTGRQMEHHCTTKTSKGRKGQDGGNGNRETERRGPVVSQEPRLIETAAALGWAQGRFGLVDVIDTRCNR